MRLSTLDLIAFGPFSDNTLALTPELGVVDVVYGDNEAGKSTSLRAIGSFLYGIPRLTTDDWIHSMPTLRVGATVVGGGSTIPCIRRKGQKETLRDLNDAPIDEGFLEQMLAGLDRDMFEQMYALSREQLARGAADLLTGNGALGEALFGASLGLAGINTVLRQLETEAAEVFKPHGQNPKLNRLLADLEGVRRRARDAELRPADYQDLQEALEHALEERERLVAALAVAEADIQRARRNQQLIPLTARREQLLAELDAYCDAAVLAETAREERIDAERQLAAAAAEIERSERKVQELRDALKALAPRTQLLAHAMQIRDLHKNISAHQKAARDLPGIKAGYRAAMQEAEALLKETHPARTLADVEDLRPTVAAVARIDELSDEHVRLAQATLTAEQTLEEERRNHARARTAAERAPRPEDTKALRGALEAARRLGEIEEQLAADETRLSAAKQEIATAVSALGFAGTPTELEALPVPTDTTIARFANAGEGLERNRAEIATRMRSVESRLRDDQETLAALDLAGAVPTEADLDQARTRREGQWQVIRSTLADAGEADPVATATAADSYEESVRDADEFADRLRREADRVATKASLAADITRSERELEELSEQRARLDAEADRLEAEWRSLWQPARIAPQTPGEMREWSVARTRILDSVSSLRADGASHEGRRTALAHARGALIAALDGLGHTVAEGLSLAATISMGDEVVTEHRDREAALRSADERVEDAEQREREAVATQKKANDRFDEWQARWMAEVLKLGIDPELKPEHVRRVMDAVDQMFVRLDAAAKDKVRIDGIDRDTGTFAEAVASLAEAVAPELVGLSADQAVTQLHEMLETAKSEAAQAELIDEQLAELEQSLEEAHERQRQATHELERLTKDARCSTAAELPAAEARSADVLRLRGEIAGVEENMTLLAAASPGQIAADVADLELADVEAELLQLEQRTNELSARYATVAEDVGQIRSRLEELRGSDDAAELHAEAESIKAEIRTYAERYARLRLAATILRRQIDDFRERSHGPLLKRAGHFFAKLTCGQYAGLGTGFDAKDNVVLLGRRKSGRELTVDKMSTGTRDQLYLALRLATLEQQAERGEPLPLIVDDLFEGYDDKRAAAGFEALAEIAEKTQVIFFTHHHHLVEIAQRTLSPDKCHVQELAEATSATAEAA